LLNLGILILQANNVKWTFLNQEYHYILLIFINKKLVQNEHFKIKNISVFYYFYAKNGSFKRF
jgi:hypothetical protein